jgi:hypothetical protein
MTRQSFVARSGAGLWALVCVAALGQTPATSTIARDHQSLFAHFEVVDATQLKAVYLRCARDSSQRLLGFDEAARCSIAGEVLKTRVFGGDFNALLAWWLKHRDDRIDEPNNEGKPVLEAVRRLP